MKSITKFFDTLRVVPTAFLLAAGLSLFAVKAQASESGAGSPRDSRCETRDTCTNLQAPAPDVVVEARA